MADTDKQQLDESVKQHTRMAAGAWVDGEELTEKQTATLPRANSDHGNFEKSAIDKKNA